ncbi:MAG: outer membrane beta-barrel protein [Armatimonadetes bacterium]|nr:outer membrane beta-barrel protein [Armatimonadota bacterium]
MRKVLPIVLAVSACMASMTLAADDEKKPGSFGIAISAQRPTDSNVRTTLGSTWFGGQIDYTWAQPKGDLRVGVGYSNKSNAGVKVTTVPLKATWLLPLGTDTEQDGKLPRAYWGLGAGVYRVKVETPLSESSTKLGGGILLGSNFNTNWRAELGYDYVSTFSSATVGSIKPGYFSLSLGYQF